MSAVTEMKSIIIALLGMFIIALPTITIGILYSPAMAQYTAGTPYPYTPGGPTATTPPYSNMAPSYPYTQTPQQQPPIPALPSSPSSPQYILPSPQNPSQNPQQILPPQSSSPSSLPSSTNSTSATNTTNTGNMLNSMQPQRPQFQPSQLPPGTAMTGPQMSSLTVITRLNTTGIGSTSSTSIGNASNINNTATASFPQVVTNAYANPDGYTVVYHFIRGSQTGVVLNLPPGIYSVSDQSSNNINNKTSSPLLSSSSSSLTHTYSGDCNNVRSIAGDIVGYGQINLGESKTCIITYNSSNK
jgi:hypothetical protein